MKKNTMLVDDIGALGVRWGDPVATVEKAKGAEWGQHPACDPSDGPSPVLFLPAPKIGAVTGVALAHFDKKRLVRVEVRYPGKLPSCRALAKKPAADHARIISDVASAFGFDAPVRGGTDYKQQRKAGKALVVVHASSLAIDDYAGVVSSQPGVPAPLVEVLLARGYVS